MKEARNSGKIAYFSGKRLIGTERKKTTARLPVTPPSHSSQRSTVSTLVEQFTPKAGEDLPSPLNNKPGTTSTEVMIPNINIQHISKGANAKS